MPGKVLFSSTGPQARSKVWADLEGQGWTLVVPTPTFADMLKQGYPAHAKFWKTIVTLSEWASEGKDPALGAKEVCYYLGEAADGTSDELWSSAWQVLRWHHQGWLTSADVSEQAGTLDGLQRAALERLAKAEKAFFPQGLPTGAALCAQRAQSDDVPSGAKAYLEGFVDLSPSEMAWLNAVVAKGEGLVRLRHVSGVPPVETGLERLVGRLGQSGQWQAAVDSPPPDWESRQLLAETLFPKDGASVQPLAAGDRVRVGRFDSIGEEFEAVIKQVNGLLKSGVTNRNIVVALPDAHDYRAHGALLKRLGSPPRFLHPVYADKNPLGQPAMPLFPREIGDIQVIGHCDIRSRATGHLFMMGAGRVHGPEVTGYSLQREEHLPSFLLDAVEAVEASLWVSGTRANQSECVFEALSRGFQNPAGW
ncbi:MAG: hypothetical protein KC561_12345 [Myxococcales bacterium]|nr:hypothetical protein [Myxococcales bacterium]